VPGALVGDRFRIVSILGRGGMGVVYRADDLRLGQPVALKVLPERVARDPKALAGLHDEVRVARSVSHPNVCRVFDIGEAEGLTYISMEYVDGEDLSSLLHRIGRLPAQKVRELAHQLCAGLAAAHDRGVVHRDLKPANVMVDGHGRARITDFGLAVAGRDDPRAADIAGTPAYMAPEQLAGEPATFQSDLFALGLVLYEAATGHHAFRATTIAQLRQAHTTGASAPSLAAPDLEPALERAILRCLEPAPTERPSSAREVARLLPGGDPLLAALEAGLTPSPEMVAAAGGEGTLRPPTAWALLGGVVLALAVGAWTAQRSAPLATAPPPKSPEVLLERGREIVAKLGLPTNPADDVLFLEPVWRVSSRPASPTGPARAGGFVAPSSLIAVYRQSPRLLLPRSPFRTPSANDPPNDVPGMVSLRLGPQGRLLGLLYVPTGEDASVPGLPDPWPPLLAEAGLDSGALVPITPRRLAPVPFDRRVAWTLEGAGGASGDGLEVTAATFGRRPVFFEVRGSFSAPGSPWTTWAQAPRNVVLGIGFTLLTLLLWGAGGFFTRRNLRLGRGDRKGAFRIAASFFVLEFANLLLTIHWVPDARAVLFSLVRVPTAVILLQACGVWLLYLAVEPSFRSRWPQLFVSWNRLVAGRLRDPLVGRDLLGGVLGGAVLAALLRGAAAFAGTAALVERGTGQGNLALFLGTGPFLGHVLGAFADGFVFLLPGLLVLLAANALVRRSSVAFVVATPICAVAFSWILGFPLPASLVLSGAVFFVLFRAGLLPLCFASITSILLLSLPGALSGPAWLVKPTFLGIAITLGAALWGFRTALGGQPLAAGKGP
jgi:serine/threonine-protein kinase